MAKKNIGIYAIIVNDFKMYIGQSIRIEDEEINGKKIQGRITQHFVALRNNRHGITKTNKKVDHLQNAFNKYGEQAFRWEILEHCRESKLTEKEQYYLDYYNSHNPNCGYNKALKTNHSPEAEEQRMKISIANKGRKHTPEMNKRKSERMKGKKMPREGVEKASLLRRKYKHLVPEWRELRKQEVSFREIGRRYNIWERIVIKYLTIYYPEIGDVKAKKGLPFKYKQLVSEWKELRRQGLPYNVIAKRYSVDDKTVYKYLNKLFPDEDIVNIKTEKKTYIHLWNEWRELRLQGLSYYKIAKMYNVAFRTVKDYFIKYYPEEEIVRIKTEARKYIKFVEEWKELKKLGLNYVEIGKKYNINPHTIRDYIVKYYP